MAESSREDDLEQAAAEPLEDDFRDHWTEDDQDVDLDSLYDDQINEQLLASNHREKNFGRYIQRVRKTVYNESLRQFGTRLGLSAGYIGKLEQGSVSVPKRQTVLKMARQLEMDPDPLLVLAGYATTRTKLDPQHLFVMQKLRSIDPDAVPLVIQYIDFLAERFPNKSR